MMMRDETVKEEKGSTRNVSMRRYRRERQVADRLEGRRSLDLPATELARDEREPAEGFLGRFGWVVAGEDVRETGSTHRQIQKCIGISDRSLPKTRKKRAG
jgi:hypothetical protein